MSDLVSGARCVTLISTTNTPLHTRHAQQFIKATKLQHTMAVVFPRTRAWTIHRFPYELLAQRPSTTALINSTLKLRDREGGLSGKGGREGGVVIFRAIK